MGKGRAGLITSVMIGLLAITTAGVSTYAWFQANVEVRISASPSSAEITVQAPDDIVIGTPHLYKYNGGYYSNTPDITFSIGAGATQFTLISSAGTDSNMYPGDKATYCIVVEQTSGRTISGGSLDLGNSASYTVTKPAGSGSYYLLGGTEDSPTEGSASTNVFKNAVLVSGEIKSSSSAVYNDNPVTNGANPVDSLSICEIDSLSDVDTIYIYFTIMFSDESDTYYQEYTRAAANNYSKTYVKQPSNSDRFFYKTTTGNSNIYEGWKIILNTLVVSVF